MYPDELLTHENAAISTIIEEAHYLDAKKWESWLELYTEDCEFWVPCWLNEYEVTQDPQSQLSLIYYDAKAGLRDRIDRITSGTSIASTPAPRTMHAVTNFRASSLSQESALVLSNVSVDCFDLRSQRTTRLFGHYEHELRPDSGKWRIAKKKITILTEVLDTSVDIYLV
jgi:3-phenylpropionate/cinnamic acid dioxygenase small subunit